RAARLRDLSPFRPASPPRRGGKGGGVSPAGRRFRLDPQGAWVIIGLLQEAHMSKVAFIGLGAMGSRMAMNLLAAGHELRVFNRSKEKTKPFADKGAKVCGSPAEAAKGAEFVCSIVSDDIATREVMLGASGVVGAAANGTIILDSSTNTPAMAREVAFEARAK